MKSIARHEMPMVNVVGVNHFYGEGEGRNQVLFNNNLVVSHGEFVTMSGPSGSGKTTLMTLMGALRSVQEGRIAVMGRELYGLGLVRQEEIRREIGFIFQGHNLFEALTAYQNVRLATRLRSYTRDEASRRTEEMLTKLGLGERMHHKPQKLSGGQKQRVAIGRALVNRPPLILADEPTAALDTETSQTVLDLFHWLVEHGGSTIIMITHDERIIAEAGRHVRLLDGRIVSE